MIQLCTAVVVYVQRRGGGGEGQMVLELFESLFGTVIVCYGSMDLCFWINLLLYYF